MAQRTRRAQTWPAAPQRKPRRRHPLRTAGFMASLLGSYLAWHALHQPGQVAGWGVTAAVMLFVPPLLLLNVWFIPEMAAGLVPRSARIRRRDPERCGKTWLLRRPRNPDRGRNMRKRLRDAVLIADRRRCVHCGSHKFLEVDHILAWRAGGLTALWNLVTLCKLCNDVKSNYNVDRDGYVHYRPFRVLPGAVDGPHAAEYKQALAALVGRGLIKGLNDREAAARILAAEKRARLNLLRWVRAAWVLE